MDNFKERERGYENKFAHDAELQFRAIARRNKLVGLWAAELLGKTGDEARAYASEVIRADFEEAGHEDVVRKLVRDLDGSADEETIRGKMAEMLTEAQRQIMSEIE